MKLRIVHCWLAAAFFGSLLSLSAGPVVTNVFAGAMQSFLVFSDGSLWASGNNSWGELGDGTFNYPIYRFKRIHTNGAAFVAAAGQHTLLLNADGSLEAVGDNVSGDLGNGGSNPANKFVGVNVVPTGAISISAGVSHSMFVTKSGALMGMGGNNQAQLGDGTENDTNKPEQIVRLNVVQVACSSSASFYVRTDGTVWGTGLFNKGRLDGNGNRFNLVYGRDAASVACGAQHAFIVTTNGALLAFGSNNEGQLGDGTTNGSHVLEQIVPNGVVSVSCSGSHSHFIKSDGSLWAMGYNANGELGDGSTNNSLVPEQIVPNSVVAVAAGLGHCLYLKTDGSVWASGYNGVGCFGDGFTNTALTAVQVVPVSTPTLTAAAVPGVSDLQISATCPAGGIYHLLASPDLSQPITQWTSLATNVIRDRDNNIFSATLTNAVASGASQRFYRLESP